MATPLPPEPPPPAEPTQETDEALREGLALHTQGKLAEARAIYEAVLAMTPEHPDALHLMGLLDFTEGRTDQGVGLLRRAIAKMPDFSMAVANLGMMLSKLHRPAEALAAYRQAVDLAPADPVARRDLGYALIEERQLADAVDNFHRAIALNPEDFVAHVGLGLAMYHQQRYPEAAASLRHALGLRPAQWEIHSNLGVVLRMQGRIDEAIGSFRVALLLRPDYAEAMLNLALALIERGRHDEALDLLGKAAIERPTRGEIHFATGHLLLMLGRPEEAVAALFRAVETIRDPSSSYTVLADLLRVDRRWQEMAELERLMVARQPARGDRRVGLARALMRLGRLDEAMSALRRGLALDPTVAGAHQCAGAILAVQGEAAAAREAFQAALALDPEEPIARTGLATLALQDGDFATGWPAFEARFDLPELAAYRSPNPVPPWAPGASLAGRRVQLYAEQGLGDTLQFVRYAPQVAAQGATVVLEVQAPLVPLLAGLPGVETVIAQGATPPEFDLACPMLSLPLCFGTTLATIPAQVPYLAVPPDRVAQWRGRLAAGAPAGDGRRRVALCWSGNPATGTDQFRSIPLATLRPLLEHPGLRVHLVQTDIRAGDDELVAGLPGLVDLRRDLGDFADTAAVLGEMDLVISVDTALAHLAGGLGRPVWVLLPIGSDWRWLRDRNDSPWYPTARLFRQRTFGDWDGVVAEVLAALPSAG